MWHNKFPKLRQHDCSSVWPCFGCRCQSNLPTSYHDQDMISTHIWPIAIHHSPPDVGTSPLKVLKGSVTFPSCVQQKRSSRGCTNAYKTYPCGTHVTSNVSYHATSVLADCISNHCIKSKIRSAGTEQHDTNMQLADCAFCDITVWEIS